MYGSIFLIYGVGLWYGAKLVRDSYLAHPECHTNDFSGSGCFSGGDVMLVRHALACVHRSSALERAA